MEKILASCPTCHQPIRSRYYFCPNCGTNLKESPRAISVLTQIGLYALAIFLPPLGSWPGAKYLMKKGSKAKGVGATTMILTIVSTIVTTWFIMNFFNSYINQLTSVLSEF